ncbi:hypothetical protein Y032_0387g450 [Ancylostoma ceylanicum]|uniref:Uncharacterized protein n=1 Tax=Ancylostoma ceylanicum TaxID=53326 RepID=A0A016RSJ1_9BILA|nr:hypothetical protein Y032_0387g450 [Ancylostoma ceylanicum]
MRQSESPGYAPFSLSMILTPYRLITLLCSDVKIHCISGTIAGVLISGPLPVLIVEPPSSSPTLTTTVRWCVGPTCTHVSTRTSFERFDQVEFLEHSISW